MLFDTPVSLQTTDGQHHETVLIEISRKGALTKIPEDWPVTPDGMISLCIHLDNAEAMINMQCHIVHTENDAIGFHCHSMGMESITHLRRLVGLNLGDPDLLERELAALG